MAKWSRKLLRGVQTGLVVFDANAGATQVLEVRIVSTGEKKVIVIDDPTKNGSEQIRLVTLKTVFRDPEDGSLNEVDLALYSPDLPGLKVVRINEKSEFIPFEEAIAFFEASKVVYLVFPYGKVV